MCSRKIAAAAVLSSLLSVVSTAAQSEDWSAYAKASEEIKKMNPAELGSLAAYLAECSIISHLQSAIRSCQVARNKFKIQYGAVYPMVDAVIESAEKDRELRRIIGSTRASSYTEAVDSMLSDGVQAGFKAQKK